MQKGDVELRDLLESDLPILFEFQREPEANKMAAYSARESEEFAKHMSTNILGSPGVKTKAIIWNGEVVGDITSWDSEGRRFIGYWLGQEYWGKGIASVALKKFLTEVDLLRPLFASVASHNIASIRILEKFGFKIFGDRSAGPDGILAQLMVLEA